MVNFRANSRSKGRNLYEKAASIKRKRAQKSLTA